MRFNTLREIPNEKNGDRFGGRPSTKGNAGTFAVVAIPKRLRYNPRVSDWFTNSALLGIRSVLKSEYDKTSSLILLD